MKRLNSQKCNLMIVTVCLAVVLLMLPGCGSDDETPSPPSSENSVANSTPTQKPPASSVPSGSVPDETSPVTGTPTEQLLGISLEGISQDADTMHTRPQSVTLPAAQREALTQQRDGVVQAFQTDDTAAILKLVYPGNRDAVKDLLANAANPTTQFAQALASGQLIAATDVMAEYEIIMDGKAYPVVFMYEDGQWFLYAF